MKYVFENKQLCAGCGACAGICKHIEMSETAIGHYRPKRDSVSCTKCGLCGEVCPILQSTENMRQLNGMYFDGKYRMETGYYISCYEGKSIKHVKTSASGGLCTAFLETLLDKNLVDGVYCVGNCREKNTFYEYKFVNDSKELRKNSLSAYYPVNLKKVIRRILSEEQTVAIVVLPCQAKALRLAMEKNKILKKRIKFLVGLVCGGLPGKAMTDYISKNIDAQDVERITFREKSEDKKCNNCAIRFYTKEDVKKSYFHNDTFGFAYFNKFFHNQACNICEDVFAESADVAFGDAWYDEYRENIWGTSICLVRNVEIEEIFHNIKDIDLKEIDVERLILAQKNVGVISAKKEAASQNYNIYKLLGYKNGNVKESLSRTKCKRLKIYIISLIKIFKQFYAERIWLKYKKGKIRFTVLDKKFKLINRILKRR